MCLRVCACWAVVWGHHKHRGPMLIYVCCDLLSINKCYIVCLMVFNATFNNISVTSWRSVLLVEEIGGPEENHRPVASH